MSAVPSPLVDPEYLARFGEVWRPILISDLPLPDDDAPDTDYEPGKLTGLDPDALRDAVRLLGDPEYGTFARDTIAGLMLPAQVSPSSTVIHQAFAQAITTEPLPGGDMETLEGRAVRLLSVFTHAIPEDPDTVDWDAMEHQWAAGLVGVGALAVQAELAKHVLCLPNTIPVSDDDDRWVLFIAYHSRGIVGDILTAAMVVAQHTKVDGGIIHALSHMMSQALLFGLYLSVVGAPPPPLTK